MEAEEKQRNDIKWLLETLCHLQDWLNEDDRTLKQSELDKLVKRYKDLQSSNKVLISKTNKVEMQYKLEQDLDQVSINILKCCGHTIILPFYQFNIFKLNSFIFFPRYTKKSTVLPEKLALIKPNFKQMALKVSMKSGVQKFNNMNHASFQWPT